MQELIEQMLQGFMLVAALGLMFIILYQIFRLATGLFLIGFISGLIFLEVYGIYLFFTERYQSLYRRFGSEWDFEFYRIFYCFEYSASVWTYDQYREK